MPVAVPTGEYELTATLDLSPALGTYEFKKTVRIEQPPADILDRRISELRSKQVEVRRKAAEDLLWFPKAGAKAGPALLAALDDADSKVRSAALVSLTSFPKSVASHTGRILKILRGGEGIDQDEQLQAANFLAHHAPASAEIEPALAEMARAEDEELQVMAMYALENYRERVGQTAKPGEAR